MIADVRSRKQDVVIADVRSRKQDVVIAGSVPGNRQFVTCI